MHTAEEIGIDDFQAKRSPDERYRTSPLKGLWTHQKGGFFHDGRFPTLLAVVDHYNTFFSLGLSDSEKHDLVEYLKSLSDDVPPSTMVDTTVTIQLAPSHETVRWRLSASPTPANRGDAVRLQLVGMTPE